MSSNTSWFAPPEGAHVLRSRWTNVWVFLLFLLPMVVVYQPTTGWNVNTRLALVYAVVEQGTFSIDAYHEGWPMDTMDKAVFEGRYYSDKVFGVSLLALPAFFFLYHFAGLFAFDLPFQVVNHLLRLWAVSLPGALGLWVMWRLLVGLGGRPIRSLLLLASAFFGSMWFGYATVFMPYVPGIAALAVAMHLLLFPFRGVLDRTNGFWIGLLCGFAMICDFIFGLAVLAVCALYLARLWHERGSVPLRASVVGIGALAGLLPLLLFAAYSTSIFGKPTIPYEYEALELFREGMQEGFMGVTSPKPRVFWYLTLHPYRGVFFWSPWILAALGGAVWLLTRGRDARDRWLAGCAIYAFVAYLLFNSGYYMWWGGFAMGPRLMLPMMAFLPFGFLAIARMGVPRWVFAGAMVLGLVSMGLSTPIAIMDPQVRQGNPHDLIVEAGNPTGAIDLSQHRLAVPQFVYLSVFYDRDLLWFRNPDTGEYVRWRLLTVAGFLVLLGGGAAAAVHSIRRVGATPIPARE